MVEKESSEPIKLVKKVTELACAEVRWFFEKAGESKWTAFGGYDSMALELTYRRKHKIEIDEKTKQMSDNFPKTDRVLLFDNFYEWNPKLNQDIITSVYWKEDTIKIRRGTWFYADSMQPLEPALAEKIEKHHLDNFRGQHILNVPEPSKLEVDGGKSVLTTLKLDENDEVKWNSVADVSYHANTRMNYIVSIFTRSVSGYPLKRGFNLEAEIDVQSEFSDLILVIHGIGQKGYENLIAKNTSQIRDSVETLMKANFPNEKRRPMILPIEWRSALVLDKGLTDIITLPRMQTVRNALNSVALDIMYYQSPLYRQEIINGVIRCLNTAYGNFIKSHPNFNGPVSIFAHSLGSVIAYDIVTSWSPLVFYDEFVTQAIEKQRDSTKNEEMRKMYDNFHKSRSKLMEKGSQLRDILLNVTERISFKVKFLFCIGSPLAVYIVMRGHSDSFIPEKSQCERLINIFHPYDPIAYRLEPLFHKSYKNVRPVRIFSYSECDKDYEKLEPELRLSYLMKMCELVKKDGTGCDSRPGSRSSSPQARSPLTPNNESVGSPVIKTTRSLVELLLETVPDEKRLSQRLDYALQPQFGDLTLSYLALMKSHSAYWYNLDVVGFVLNQLYPKPSESKQEKPSESKQEKPSERKDRKG